PLLSHVLGNDAREHVGHASGRIGNDNADGMTGEAVLRVRRATCSQYRQQRRKRRAKMPPLHGAPCPVLAGSRCPYFEGSMPVVGAPSKTSVLGKPPACPFRQ